jgi:hypothetical protein
LVIVRAAKGNIMTDYQLESLATLITLSMGCCGFLYILEKKLFKNDE